MEFTQIGIAVDWIQKMPIFLFIPFAFFASVLGALVITELIMKWLELAFGFVENPSPSIREEGK